MRLRRSALALLVAGCAATPDDPLVWSDDVVRSRSREAGDVVEVEIEGIGTLTNPVTRLDVGA